MQDLELLGRSAHLVEAVTDPSLVSSDADVQRTVAVLSGRLAGANGELGEAAKAQDEDVEENKQAASDWDAAAVAAVREYDWLLASLGVRLLQGPPEERDKLGPGDMEARERFLRGAFPLSPSDLARTRRSTFRSHLRQTAKALESSPYDTAGDAARLDDKLAAVEAGYAHLVAEEADDGPILSRLVRARLETELQYRCLKGVVNLLLESEHSDVRALDLVLRTTSRKKAAEATEAEPEPAQPPEPLPVV